MKQKSILLPNALIGVLMILLVLPLFILREIPSYEVPAFYVDCDSSWQTELGEMSLSDITFTDDGTITLTRTIKAGDVRSGDLCLTSSNINFNVYVDERQVYRYEPDLPWIYGASYGNDIHSVPITMTGGEAVLRIEAESLGTGVWCGFRDAHFENGADYVRQMLSSRLTHYYLTAIIFTFSVILFGMGWFFRKRDSKRPETVSLAVLGILFSLWTESSDYTIVLLTGHAGLIRVISYYSLLFLPIPGITLVCHLTRNPRNHVQKAVEVLVLLNLILHISMIYWGKYDYHHLLLATHINLIVTIILIIAVIVVSIKKNTLSTGASRVLLAAFLILSFTGIMDIILFYTGKSERMAVFSRYGFLIFMVTIGSYEVREFIIMLHTNREADLMKRLAHRDGLTGLENRLAFTEWERNLKSLKKGNCIFIQFDINNLKEVNDNYGHAAGDSFIIAGANAIHQSFGPYGRVFRTGGDEFVAILTTVAPTTTDTLTINQGKLICNNSPDVLLRCYEACEKHLLEILDTYNQTSGTPVPLVIAYGMAEYSLAQGNPEMQERLADERMYMHKRMLKSR